MGNKIQLRKVHVLGETLEIYGYDDDGYFTHITQDTNADLDVVALAGLITKRTSTILDVGANIGYETLLCATFAPQGKVYSFEPVPENFEIIKKNLNRNNVQNVKVTNIGLGSQKEEVNIMFNDSNRGGATLVNKSGKDVASKHDHHEKVTIEKLDKVYSELGIRECDLMKVDIEGHEPEFLKGATKFIGKFKPALIIEANHWCLNGLNRVSLPDFIDQIKGIYPYVAAFDGREWIDLSQDTHKFLHENIVFNKFQNLYCDFDGERWKHTMLLHAWGWDKLVEIQQQVSSLQSENEHLRAELSRATWRKNASGIKKRSKSMVKRVVRK